MTFSNTAFFHVAIVTIILLDSSASWYDVPPLNLPFSDRHGDGRNREGQLT